MVDETWPNGVTIVTVTFNSQPTIPDFIAGVEAQGPTVAKVIVVDNASGDDTVQLLERWAAGTALDVTIIRSTNSGFAGGYAVAGRESSPGNARPTLCLNPDVRLAPGVVDAMLQVLRTVDDAAIVSAPLVGLDGTPDSASIRRLPTLGRASIYGVLGRLTPNRWRYNDQRLGESPSPIGTRIEATTGALMLVHPEFRSLEDPIFDTDYWMYGEDLQLCADARDEGKSIYMVDTLHSVHVKGVSSGWPRSKKSNEAFHNAMYLYYRKNLSRGPLVDGVVWLAVQLRLFSSLVACFLTSVRRGSNAER